MQEGERFLEDSQPTLPLPSFWSGCMVYSELYHQNQPFISLQKIDAVSNSAYASINLKRNRLFLFQPSQTASKETGGQGIARLLTNGQNQIFYHNRVLRYLCQFSAYLLLQTALFFDPTLDWILFLPNVQVLSLWDAADFLPKALPSQEFSDS